MATFFLNFNLQGTFSAIAPVLEIYSGNNLIARVDATASSSYQSLRFPSDFYGGAFSLRLRSDGLESGRSITLSDINVNGLAYTPPSNVVTDTSFVSLPTTTIQPDAPQSYDQILATITGTSGNDTLTGTASADTISGLAGIDNINAGEGDDTVYGGDGNDVINGAGGANLLYGDGGDDRLFGGTVNDRLYGGIGNDFIRGGAGADMMYGEDGVDDLRGDDGDDSIYGGAGNDVIQGGAGNDTIDGGTNDDTIRGGDGNDVIIGGDGIDNIHGQNGNDNISGGLGDDLIRGDFGNDTIYGGDGDDRLYGAEDNDIIRGDVGDDTVSGGIGDDYLYGGDGGDLLDGNEGADFLYGEVGSDSLSGGDGNDTLDGGSGNDLLIGGLGADVLRGGTNNDVLIGSDRPATLTALNFTNTVFTSYGSGQDSTTGTTTVAWDGNVITMTGNQWKKAAINYTITANTWIEFEFKSTREPEMAMIGFDTDSNEKNSVNRFKLGGGQTQVSISAPQDETHYQSLGGWQKFAIKVGDYFTGNMTYLTFIHDQDKNGSPYSQWRNIVLHEGNFTDTHANTLYGGDGIDKLYGGARNDVLYGDAGDDFLYSNSSSSYSQTLAGGTGDDELYGGAGRDYFTYLNASERNDTDTIFNFSTSQLDTLDFSDIIVGWNASRASDFVRFSTSRGDTLIEVDYNGSTGGRDFDAYARIDGVTGLNVNTMLANGTLIMS